MSEAPSPGGELQQLRQDNARLQGELAALKRELDDVAHAIGHDLRAPLRHITAFAGLLREDLGDALTGDPAMYLRTVDDASRHLGRMIDGLLAWSRLGRQPLHLAPVAQRPLVDEVCASLAPQCQGRQVHWQLADSLHDAQADATLLRQLWQQLLGNALKFTARCDVAVIAVEAARLPNGQWQWSVRDNGAGFNPLQSSKLGQVFARLHSANEFEGLGLGLATAARIVQRHGGTLSADSAGSGQGCCVRWTLPAA